jgi:hypothetical protein
MTDPNYWEKVAEEKQRGAEAPEEPIAQLEDEETISDAPLPKVINPALTGRIRPEWKGNGK